MQSPRALAVYYGPAMRNHGNAALNTKRVEAKYLVPPRIPSSVFVENSAHKDSPMRMQLAKGLTESGYYSPKNQSKKNNSNRLLN